MASRKTIILLSIFCVFVSGCCGRPTSQESVTPSIQNKPLDELPSPTATIPFIDSSDRPQYSHGLAYGESKWSSFSNANFVTGLVFDQEGNLWAASTGGVVKWDVDTGAYTKYTTDDGLASNNVQAIVMTSDGSIWVGTVDGISRYTGSEESEHADLAAEVEASALPSGTKDGKSWQSLYASDGLAGNYVSAIAVGPDGNLWFGTRGNGVSRYSGMVASTDNISGTKTSNDECWRTYTTEDGLVSNDILSIAQASDGTLWFGTYGKGVSRFDGENWSTHAPLDGMANMIISTIEAASDGALWFGTYLNGALQSINSDANTDSNLATSTGEQSKWNQFDLGDSQLGNTAFVIQETPNGDIWFGTGEGAVRFDGESWRSYTTEDGLTGNYVTAMAVGPDGALYFGTFGEGVTRLSAPSNTLINDSRDENTLAESSESNSFTNVSNERDNWHTFMTDDGLGSNMVLSIAEALDGALWFGTDWTGVSRYSGAAANLG